MFLRLSENAELHHEFLESVLTHRFCYDEFIVLVNLHGKLTILVGLITDGVVIDDSLFVDLGTLDDIVSWNEVDQV